MSDKPTDSHIPLLLRLLENALRSGYSLPQAFALVADELPGPLGEATAAAIAQLAAGAPFETAMRGWAVRAGGADALLVVATILVQLETGGNLADKFQLLGQVLVKRRELAAA